LALVPPFLTAEPKLHAKLQDALEDGRMPRIIVTAVEVRMFQNAVTTHGLPPAFIQALVRAGATSAIIDRIRRLITTLDPHANELTIVLSLLYNRSMFEQDYPFLHKAVEELAGLNWNSATAGITTAPTAAIMRAFTRPSRRCSMPALAYDGMPGATVSCLPSSTVS
jgi:hypothetical protein